MLVFLAEDAENFAETAKKYLPLRRKGAKKDLLLEARKVTQIRLSAADFLIVIPSEAEGSL